MAVGSPEPRAQTTHSMNNTCMHTFQICIHHSTWIWCNKNIWDQALLHVKIVQKIHGGIKRMSEVEENKTGEKRTDGSTRAITESKHNNQDTNTKTPWKHHHQNTTAYTPLEPTPNTSRKYHTTSHNHRNIHSKKQHHRKPHNKFHVRTALPLGGAHLGDKCKCIYVNVMYVFMYLCIDVFMYLPVFTFEFTLPFGKKMSSGSAPRTTAGECDRTWPAGGIGIGEIAGHGGHGSNLCTSNSVQMVNSKPSET